MFSRVSGYVVSAAVSATEDECQIVRYSGFAGGMIFAPLDTDITTVTFQVSPDGVMFYDLEVEGSAVSMSVTGGVAEPLPDALYAAPFFRMVGDTTGVVGVVLKS